MTPSTPEEIKEQRLRKIEYDIHLLDRMFHRLLKETYWNVVKEIETQLHAEGVHRP